MHDNEQEVAKLSILLLNWAVKSHQNEYFINEISHLDCQTWQTLMAYIQEMEKPDANLNDPNFLSRMCYG